MVRTLATMRTLAGAALPGRLDSVVHAAGVVELGPVAELGLDGRLRPVRGVLPSVLAARAAGMRRVVVAASNAAEAALVDGVDVRTAGHLGDIVAWLTGDGPPLELAVPPPDTADTAPNAST